MRTQLVNQALTTNIWDGENQLGQWGIPVVGYGSGGVSYLRMEIPSPSPTATLTAFSLANAPASGSETIFLNGIAQDPTITRFRVGRSR